MINPIYNLPEINFIGGESQTLIFNLYTKEGTPFDANGCTLGFAIINYVNKNGVPILVKQTPDIEIKIGESGIPNIAIVNLLPEDTVYFQGRYVYQITVYDSYGETEIPGQGIINIIRNIHQSFITD